MSNNLENQIKLVGLIFIGGIFTIVHALKKIKNKTKIQNTSKQIISAASAGSVEIEGVAWPLRTFHHTLEGKKAVCRSITIKKRVKRGKNSNYETVWTKHSSEPFLVFDHTGYLLIEPAYSINQLAIADDVEEKKYNPRGLSLAAVNGFQDFYDNSVSGFSLSTDNSFFSKLFSSEFIILEKVIEIGSPLLIHAYLTPGDTARFILEDAILKSFREKISRVIKSKALQLSILDKDKDGKVDDKELRRGFQGALSASLKSPLSITEIKNVGTSIEKIYGNLRSSATEELRIHNSFEEQFLNSNPIMYNWIMLYFGAALIGGAIVLFYNFVIKS